MDLHLTGKRAFVSGSTQGIGYASAKALLSEGATVVINGRSAESVASAVVRLKDEVPGASVSGIAADLADASQTESLVAELSGIGILINNIGIFDIGAFADTTDDDWLSYFTINVMSAVRLSRSLLPSMLASDWGRIIFIGSESGVNVPADMVAYGVTKAANIALSNGLAKLTRGTEVTINTVLGGPTYSHGVSRAVEQIAEAQGMPVGDLKAAIIGGNQTSLLERFIEPDEIAALVTYLASPLSSATNGAALRADGGVLTGIL